MSIIEQINEPKDIKTLSIPDLETLSGEIRHAILNRDSKIGGHVGPNLGIVEAAIALHYVFDSPKDKIVYDVSHQSYPHKILTGRKQGFINDALMETVSGYTNPDESAHDHFVVGHTSTSVSLACGLAKARDIKGEKHNVIALIGDGSLSGGEAFEGFNNAAVLNSNLIIVVNDNEMSIAENHGGLYANLKTLRDTDGQASNNMFKALGFEYRYVENGNSLPDLIEAFKNVKDVQKPVVVHIHTLKGKGYALAEENKETWHWNLPFDVNTGTPKIDMSGVETYNGITVQYLRKKVESNPEVVVVNAGTPGAFGITSQDRKKFGKNFVDVGIAEEHAVAMSSALAKGGCKPVFLVFSSFVQRTYDQLSHDLAINNNPAVIIVGGAGISGADVTHLGIFDIPLIANIPNIVYLAPTSKEEYLAMLEWGIEQSTHPVVIRMPQEVNEANYPVDLSYNNINSYKIIEQGNKVAILGLGSFFKLGSHVVDMLKNKGINATLINPRFISGIDEELLKKLETSHDVVVTLEDGILDGGFGEKISRFYGVSPVKVLNYGAKKEFTDRVPHEELYQRYRLMPELIVEDILKALTLEKG